MVSELSKNEELQKEIRDWMKENVEPYVTFLNTISERETKEIYTASRNLLAATLIGVFIGVLTNISAEYLTTGEIPMGVGFLVISIAVALFSFHLWRFYLVKDLQEYVEKLFYGGGKSLKEKFEKDFGVSSPEEETS